MSLLHKGGLSAAGLRGLQRRARVEKAVYEPGQALQPQAQRHLRRFSTSRQGCREAGPLYGPLTLCRGVNPKSETNSKSEIPKPELPIPKSVPLPLISFPILNFEFVSDFEFRNSDLIGFV